MPRESKRAIVPEAATGGAMLLVPPFIACQICVCCDWNRRNHHPSPMRLISTVMTMVELKSTAPWTSAELMMQGLVLRRRCQESSVRNRRRSVLYVGEGE